MTTTTLRRQPREIEDIRKVIMQEKRPEILEKPAHGARNTYRGNGTFMRAFDRRWKGAINSNGDAEGFHFIFSESPFNIMYKANGDDKHEIMGLVHAAVVPGRLSYCIEHRDTTYVSRISNEIAVPGSHLPAPVGFTMPNIMRHLGAGGKPNKLVVPERWQDEIGAEWGKRIHSQEEKYIVIGPENQEFSVGNSRSPQDFHMHMDLTETYTTFSGMRLHYIARGRFEVLHIEPGETVVVPNGIAHYVVMNGDKPTFVTMASSVPIKNDKFVMPPHMLEMLNGDRLKSLARD